MSNGLGEGHLLAFFRIQGLCSFSCQDNKQAAFKYKVNFEHTLIAVCLWPKTANRLASNYCENRKQLCVLQLKQTDFQTY